MPPPSATAPQDLCQNPKLTYKAMVLMPGAVEPARTDRRLALTFATLTWLPALARPRCPQ
ncbi:hypothetical protein AB0I94_28160 [Streptomyces sp. NPDC050147]|uniref:hypothetical protein n=1 Tax=Streptomyces sp. NPDC050147 TaxID=3155513 RepID=UPI00344526C8